MEKMNGQNIKDIIFRKKDQITAMNDNAGVNIEGETDAQFCPGTSYCCQSVSEEELPSLFTYELCA